MGEKMDILYLHTRLTTPGGANRFIVESANRLSATNGANVTIATQTFNRNHYSVRPTVKIHEYGGPPPSSLKHWLTWPQVFSKFSSVLRNQQFDLIVYHSIPLPYWTPVIRHFQPNAQFIWYAHAPNAYLNEPGKLTDVPQPLRSVLQVGLPAVSVLDRHLIDKQIDYIIANSEYTKGVVERVYTHDASVVHPGVDIKRYTPKNAVDSRDRAVFTVGQLNNYKNFDLLIQSMKQMYDAHPEGPDLIIAGEGQAKSSLVKTAEDFGISDRVHFVGFVSEQELARYYATAMVTVYLPEREPFGLVPLEAMASGTPVIGPRSGGLRETVVDGKTGLLIDELTAQNISEAIIELHRNEEMRSQIGDQARRHVVEQFTWDSTVSEFSQLLRRIRSAVRG